ncbi:MAG: hypothetical protein JSW71_19730 [Gemmatimonadota bacterium]|nr:MAG: hypothetical protein JSW71_19730 [Gemmatimonadota bacterium]
MSDGPPTDWMQGLRRFLTDLRAGTERRSWKERREAERRAATSGSETDRRSNDDRRAGGDRRVMLLDRRRSISYPYAHQHAEQIRAMLLTPDASVICPRCNGDLLLGPTESRGSHTSREVRCTHCRHSVVITDLPAELAK